jgi:hypothetical protein
MNLELEDRLYTSTEVANILGVSLRSVYRYLEDKKLVADIKTATGRHRFTKQNIIDFLSPQDKKEQKEEPKKEEKEVEEKPEVKEEEKKVEEKPEEEEKEVEVKAEEIKEDVDWLAKFRSAAEKYRQQDEEQKKEPEEKAEEKPAEPEVKEKPTEAVSGLTEPEAEKEAEGVKFKYYKSGVGGLKEIAQNIDKSARKSDVEYAFTLDAGLSLHKPIRPFSVINAYVRPSNLDFFEKMLELSQVDEGNAQLCLQVSGEDEVYQSRKEMHGLFVVSDDLLKSDLVAAGKEDLAKELD